MSVVIADQRHCPGMDDDVLLRDLCQTVNERRMFEKKLRELRSEVRLCKATLDALVQKEDWLRKEALRPRLTSERPQTLEGFIGDGPVFFTLEDDVKGEVIGLEVSTVPSDTVARSDSLGLTVDDERASASDGRGRITELNAQPLEEMQVLEENNLDCNADVASAAWSDGESCADEFDAALDSIGVAKCASCGIRLPLDIDLIEQHSKDCSANKKTAHRTTKVTVEEPQESSPSGRGRLSFGLRWGSGSRPPDTLPP